MLSVRFGGLEFSSRPLPEPSEALPITRDGLTGWWGRPSGRSDMVDRAAGHGELDLPVMLSARVVGLSGVVKAEHAARRADQLAGLPVVGDFTVHEGGASRRADARLVEAIVQRAQINRLARFDLVFRCPDPRKFGEDWEFVSTGGLVRARHYGNFEASPVFEVTGFPSGYRILGPSGEGFTVTGSRPASAVDVIDFGSRQVIRNGVLLVGATSSARTWTVPAAREVSWRVQAIGSGQGRAVMRLHDTFI